MFDLIIKGGIVVDGTGVPGVKADIAITEGKISKIGEIDQDEAKEIVDVEDVIASIILVEDLRIQRD